MVKSTDDDGRISYSLPDYDNKQVPIVAVIQPLDDTRTQSVEGNVSYSYSIITKIIYDLQIGDRMVEVADSTREYVISGLRQYDESHIEIVAKNVAWREQP